jgi:hypothetical protein
MEIMQKNNRLRASAGVLAVAIATLGISLPAVAEAVQPAQLAQGSVIGQCRAVNKKVSVYKQASTTGSIVSTLNAETKVTLADTGSGGFIGISSPVSGYVQTANLKPCTGNPPTTPPTGSTCRRVLQPLGLSIRKEPSPTAAYVGGVANLARVSLTTNPATTRLGADGRNWVQIASPAAGWVSNGFPGGSSNLTLCP